MIEAICQFAQEQIKQGHKVEIVSQDSDSTPIGGAALFPIHALGPGIGSYGYCRSLTAWLVANCNRFDVVIVNGLWKYHNLAVWKVLRSSNPQYVVFPHGMLDPWFKHTYPLKHLKKLMYWRLAEYRVLRDAALVIFTSDGEKSRARESFRRYAVNESVVNLGIAAPTGSEIIQVERFFQMFPHLRGRRLILFFGRIHEKKGVHMLIQAFGRIFGLNQCGGTETGFHLVIVGPCENNAYRAALSKIAAKLFPAGAPITWTGMLRGDLKWGAYRAAEAFILPSHQENFGVSVVEALGCSLPVLISNKVNIWQEVQTDGAGIIEEDSLAGTERLLRRWLSLDENVRCDMKDAAIHCFRSRFHIQQATERLMHVLGEVVVKARCVAGAS